MENQSNRSTFYLRAAAVALLFGAGGLYLGGAVFAPKSAPMAVEEEGHAEEEEEGHVEGQLIMDEARIKAAGIVTETIAAGGLGAEILAQGVVAATPSGEAVLTARADGAIVRITVGLGDTVRAGQVVAVMESRDASSIAADSSSANANLNLARSNYAREKRLFDMKVTARQDLEVAAADLARAEAEARRATSAASAAKVTGDGRTIGVVSLISGRVTRADAKLGAYALAGTELFRVSDPNRIQVNASLLDVDAQRVQIGDTAVIELLDGTSVPATVRSITPSVDPQSKTVTIVLMPQGIAGLTTGQGLRVRIKPNVAGLGTTVTVPQDAVQSIEGRDMVFLKTVNGFLATPVTIGKRSGGRIEITEGLKAGDTIATKGAFMLKAELGKGEAEH